jgi:hypothetical protein
VAVVVADADLEIEEAAVVVGPLGEEIEEAAAVAEAVEEYQSLVPEQREDRRSSL